MSESVSFADSFDLSYSGSSQSAASFSPLASIAPPAIANPVAAPSYRPTPQAPRYSSLLVLADGTVLRGDGIGAAGVTVGELVFQTGMVGYQEAMTDPSYAGQMLIFTYPLVGNYGVGASSNQSGHIQTRGIILRDSMPSAGHRDATGELDAMLRDQGIPGIAGVDTRYLTRLVRTHGVLPAALATGPAESLPSTADLLARARALDYDHTDFVASCSTPSVVWHPPTRPDGPRIALLDYGVKESMLARLRQDGAGVLQVPASMSAEDILALRPDGVLLSNGPGDPTRLDYAVENLRRILDIPTLPVFGICLGNQLLSLAAGATTHKMNFGHRGVNQPVIENETGRLYVTTQNHGYVVDPESVPNDWRITHTNLNDGTVEGVAHKTRPVWGVQWHPEAGPGPNDSVDMIDKFVALAEANRG